MTQSITFPPFPVSAFTRNHPADRQPRPAPEYPTALAAHIRQGSLVLTATYQDGRGDCEAPLVVDFDIPIDGAGEDGPFWLDLQSARVSVNKHEGSETIHEVPRFSATLTPEDSPMHQLAAELDGIDEMFGVVGEVVSSTRLRPEQVDGFVSALFYAQNHTMVDGNGVRNNLILDLLRDQDPKILLEKLTHLAASASDLVRESAGLSQHVDAMLSTKIMSVHGPSR